MSNTRETKTITTILIHCSATTSEMKTTAEDVRTWHVNAPKWWDDIGYHSFIEWDGKIVDGRPHNVIGAHARGHNKDSLAVCLSGGIELKDGRAIPTNNFNRDQYRSLLEVLNNWLDLYPSISYIKGHYAYDKYKACPSFDVEAFLIANGMKAYI